MTAKKNVIDFKNVERLVKAEAERKTMLFQRRSNKLLKIVIAILIITFIFLK